MAYRTQNLNQSATYWGNPVSDGYGWYTFDDPVLIDCRWEDKKELFLDSHMQEKISTAIIYVGQDIDEGGYIVLGDYTDSAYTDPKDASGSEKVQKFEKIPNLRGSTFVGKVYL